MFGSEYGEAAVEVLDILDNTNKEDVSKIPSNFIKFLVEIAKEDYIVNFDHSKLISELNLKEETKEILGVIYINWWCDKKEQENYKNQIEELEKRKEEKLREKYNPNKIFENKKQKEIREETVTMIEYKESVIKKVLNKIIMIIKKSR